MAKTETVEIDWQGQKAEVVVKELTWGEMNQVLREAIGKMRLMGQELMLEVDIVAWREALVLRSIAKAPFDVTIENIRNLPPDVGERIFDAAQRLNPFRLFRG
jgi:hypothetical protein